MTDFVEPNPFLPAPEPANVPADEAAVIRQWAEWEAIMATTKRVRSYSHSVNLPAEELRICAATPSGCRRKPTHRQKGWSGFIYACTIHALYWNSHGGRHYQPLEGVVITDEERAKAKQLSCCQYCERFYLKATSGHCSKCPTCKACVVKYAHGHCPGCIAKYDGGVVQCVGCHRGQCCAQFCETCEVSGAWRCRKCCAAQPKELRHPLPPPNVHITQGIYVEQHNWDRYPEPRPLTPPYKPFLYLGVELEVECGRRDRSVVAKRILDNHKYDLLIKHDGSLENGLECVTGPMSLEEHQKFWPIIAPAILKAGGRAWEYLTPGLHVHGSRDWYTDLTIGKLMVFLNSARTKEYHVRLAGRDVWWAGPGQKITFIKKTLADGFPPRPIQARFGIWNGPRAFHALHKEFAWAAMTGTARMVMEWLQSTRCTVMPEQQPVNGFTFEQLVERGLVRLMPRKKSQMAVTHSRYEALNLQNRRTIEFRLFKSTLKTDHILANVEYCHAASNWAFDSSIREAESWPSFWEWLAQHPRHYPHLIAFFDHPRTQTNDTKIERSIKEVNA